MFARFSNNFSKNKSINWLQVIVAGHLFFVAKFLFFSRLQIIIDLNRFELVEFLLLFFCWLKIVYLYSRNTYKCDFLYELVSEWQSFFHSSLQLYKYFHSTYAGYYSTKIWIKFFGTSLCLNTLSLELLVILGRYLRCPTR